VLFARQVFVHSQAEIAIRGSPSAHRRRPLGDLMCHRVPPSCALGSNENSGAVIAVALPMRAGSCALNLERHSHETF
jgi:hypothetical protein